MLEEFLGTCSKRVNKKATRKPSERKGTPASLSCRVQRAQTSRLCFSPTASTSIEAKLVRVRAWWWKTTLRRVPRRRSLSRSPYGRILKTHPTRDKGIS